MHKPSLVMVVGRTRASVVRFRDDEGGAMSLIIIFAFLAMIYVGGIAIDVMRFETRRVAMQQTLDRAVLAAASITQTRPPQEVVNDYFAKANLGDGLFMVDFEAPTVTVVPNDGLRYVSASAKVTSKNFFMGIFSPRNTLSGVSANQAVEGVKNIEVMLVLDISSSMLGFDGRRGFTKLNSLKQAANQFVDTLMSDDTVDGVSIGVVPYSSHVTISDDLREAFRETFTVKNLATWNGVPDHGVPGINCFEFPIKGFNETGLSLTEPIQSAAYAMALRGWTYFGDGIDDFVPLDHNIAWSRICDLPRETSTTPWSDAETGHVMLPTTDANAVKTKIERLAAYGSTNIAVGMRWATALLDPSTRPIYDKLLATEKEMAGRPADNDSSDTLKVIILMTDGANSADRHVKDEFKVKDIPSPIWRTANNRFAIRFTSGGPALTGGTRPGGSPTDTCSGWQLSNFTNRQFFVPDLKRNSVPQWRHGDVNEVGTGTMIRSACDPRSWIAPEVDALGQETLRLPRYNSSGAIVGHDIAVPVDWSEVWRYAPTSWVGQQLYVRSGTGVRREDVEDLFAETYMDGEPDMDALTVSNCNAARDARMEVYGIAFRATGAGMRLLRDCSSEPKDKFYYEVQNGADISAVFQQIAARIQPLKLSQ